MWNKPTIASSEKFRIVTKSFAFKIGLLSRSGLEPKSSLVLKEQLRQRNYPHWTAWYVPYCDVQNDLWGKSHFNFDVDGNNYHVLRTGAFPFIKFHCSLRPHQNLEVEDKFYRTLKIINFGFPTLLYGLAELNHSLLLVSRKQDIAVLICEMVLQRIVSLAWRSQHYKQMRNFHFTTVKRGDELEKSMVESLKKTNLQSYELFEQTERKNKETFKKAIDLFNQRSDIRKRGSVEFIRAALKNMKQFGVHRDIDVYKQLLDIFPKGKYVPENMVQATFFHYPKQQDCGLEVLNEMNENEIIPDRETTLMIKNIYGIHSRPFKKALRMMYWMNKFKNLSPWPVPFYLPKESLELAKLAIERITSADRLSVVKVYQAEEIDEATDKECWIVSGQSPIQRDMIKTLPKDKSLYVEGAFRVWLRDVQVNYFILRGDPVPRPPPVEGDVDDVSDLKNWTLGQNRPMDLVKIPNTHEQEDGTILACCATESSSKDSLLSWIRHLQKDNPDLEDIPILFMLTSPLGPVVPVDESHAIRKN